MDHPLKLVFFQMSLRVSIYYGIRMTLRPELFQLGLGISALSAVSSLYLRTVRVEPEKTENEKMDSYYHVQLANCTRERKVL